MIRRLATHTCALVAGVVLAMLCVLPAMREEARGPSPTPLSTVNEFDAALRTVMIQMDAGMCLTPSGDADRDFARAMIPHHQGAVDMARLELRYGHDGRLRRLAQGIVVEQSQEIVLLRGVLASGPAASGAAFDP